MWTDAVDLRDFYASSLGHVAQRMIRRRVRQVWPDVRGLNVLAVGYGTPFITPFRAEAERVLAAMPAAQGVLHWPNEGGGLTALIDETELPFPDMSMDRVLLVHALECSEQTRSLLREAWRVLKGSGRLLVVAPNRRGVWARLERTPFGHGLPYTKGQLTRTLRDNMFTPLDTHAALFVPPTHWRMVLSSSAAFEEIGQRWFSTFAGVVIGEAVKQIYAGEAKAVKKTRRAYVSLTQKTPGTTTRG